MKRNALSMSEVLFKQPNLIINNHLKNLAENGLQGPDFVAHYN